MSPASSQRFRDIGDLLSRSVGLRGIFGVDCILQDDVPWVLEVNPRYTASVEVWEYAGKLSALALHRSAFESPNDVVDREELSSMRIVVNSEIVIGKAILYARENVTIPRLTPWATLGAVDPAGFDPPPFADLPSTGDQIERGHPILTFFADGPFVDDCLRNLEQRAKSLDHWLYGDV